MEANILKGEICLTVRIRPWAYRQRIHQFYEVLFRVSLIVRPVESGVASPHGLAVLCGWAAGGTLVKARDGVSPPQQVTDGVLRRCYENQAEETRDTHQASVKNHRALLFILVNVFSGLLPS